MLAPTPADAAALLTQLGCRGVVVIAFDGDGTHGASCGKSKSDGETAGRLLEAFFGRLEDGDLDAVPGPRRSWQTVLERKSI